MTFRPSRCPFYRKFLSNVIKLESVRFVIQRKLNFGQKEPGPFWDNEISKWITTVFHNVILPWHTFVLFFFFFFLCGSKTLQYEIFSRSSSKCHVIKITATGSLSVDSVLANNYPTCKRALSTVNKCWPTLSTNKVLNPIWSEILCCPTSLGSM